MYLSDKLKRHMIKQDVFIIDDNNWKSQVNITCGYKVLDTNSYYTELVNYGDHIEICGSYLQPCIYLYKISDYWALSNNFWMLKEFLEDNNLPLTVNQEVYSFFHDPKNYYNTTWENYRTEYFEINVIDNNTKLLIDVDGYHIIPVERHFKQIAERDGINILKNWIIKYSNFIKNSNYKINLRLSGGQDSRILLKMLCDNCTDKNFGKLLNRSKKKHDPTGTSLDRDYAIQSVKVLGLDKELTEWEYPYTFGTSEDYREDYFYSFKYGYDVDKHKFHVPHSLDELEYVFTGRAAESIKIAEIKKSDISFITGYFRRVFLSLDLNDYYASNKTILVFNPYMDYELLNIYATLTNLTSCMLFKLLNADNLLSIPFAHVKNINYSYDQKVIEESDKLLTTFKEINNGTI